MTTSERPNNPLASFIASKVDRAHRSEPKDFFIKAQAPLWKQINNWLASTTWRSSDASRYSSERNQRKSTTVHL